MIPEIIQNDLEVIEADAAVLYSKILMELEDRQPFFLKYLLIIEKEHGLQAALVGFVTYSLIQEAMERDV